MDINDAPQYKGDTELTVDESGDGRVLEFPLSIVDSDGGSRLLDPADLQLEVVGFGEGASELRVDNLNHANDYFALQASEIKRERLEGNGNSLALTLTLSGKLATPFNSVVELRLFGVTDGFNDFEQRLTVGVKNRPPVFELAQTQGVKVFLEQQEPATLELLEELESGARVLVLEAPADLVVKFDPAENGEEGNGKVTLRRLDTDSDDLSKEVKLAALDAAGGLTEVRIQVERPPRLPRIVPPHPLLIAEGQSGTRTLQLAADTGLNVTWTIAVAADGVLGDFIEGDYKITPVAGGHAGLSLTLVDSVAAGDEFDLLVTAFVGEEAGGYRRTAILPVVVAAAAPKPRLKLSATIADPEGPTGAVIVVSSFALGELLSIAAVLEGQLPSSEELGDGPSFQISILKLNADGEPDLAAGSITLTAASAVVGDELDISPKPVGEEQIAKLDLEVGDAVQVSIGHLLAASDEVTDSIIVGDGLVLRVSDSAGMKDEDNDGLARRRRERTRCLGSDHGRGRRGDGRRRLIPGGWRRGVAVPRRQSPLPGSRRMRRSVADADADADDGDGAAAPTLSGCGDDIIDSSLVLAPETLVELLLAEDEEYRLFDLSATFNSDEAGLDEPLVINLPVDRQQPHIVYRFDGDENDGNAGLGCRSRLPGQPGQAGLGGGGQGALADFESDCGSCFYAFDSDRDGSVRLLLLLVPMDPEPGSGFALSAEHAGLEGRLLEISGDKTETIALVGFDDLAVRITGAAIDGGNVTGTVSADDGVVELIGLRRTANGPEELLIEALDEGGVVAAIRLYVRVPNQPPEVRFMLPSGEELTTSIALAANSETLLTVIVEDLADGDQSFVLDLMDEDGNVADGRGLASLLSKLSLGGGGIDEGSDYMISHELTLSSMDIGAGEFELKVRVTDLGDGSQTFKTLSVCVLDGSGQCPAPARSGGGGGGGGGTGLLWLLFAAPAALCRDTRLRQRLAAVHNRQRGC